jgi:hypothetical protein
MAVGPQAFQGVVQGTGSGRRQDASGGPGSDSRVRGAVDNGDSLARTRQFPGQREANDSATQDQAIEHSTAFSGVRSRRGTKSTSGNSLPHS